MRIAERATPIAAIIAAFSSLACCLPFTLVGAAGLLGASARAQSMRPWLLLASAVLLIIDSFSCTSESSAERAAA